MVVFRTNTSVLQPKCWMPPLVQSPPAPGSLAVGAPHKVHPFLLKPGWHHNTLHWQKTLAPINLQTVTHLHFTKKVLASCNPELRCDLQAQYSTNKKNNSRSHDCIAESGKYSKSVWVSNMSPDRATECLTRIFDCLPEKLRSDAYRKLCSNSPGRAPFPQHLLFRSGSSPTSGQSV